MKIGKISQSIFERSVLKQFHKEQIAFLKSAGADCAFFLDRSETTDKEEKQFFFTSEVMSIVDDSVVVLALYMAANKLTAQGGKPGGATINLVLSARQSEAFLKRTMANASKAMEELGILLFDCDVEVTDAIVAPTAMVSVSGVGKKRKGLTQGQDIVMTKTLAVGGTAILAKVKEQELSAKYSRRFLMDARALENQFSVIPEAAGAVESDVSAMYPINKGGVFGALWEMADTAGVGLIIDLKKIPVRQETIEISEVFDINPYELLGLGGLLMASSDGHELVRKLGELGITAAVIGKTTDNNDRIIANDGEHRFLEPAKPDEILKVI